MPPNGLQAVFLENRTRLIRFLVARGAGDAAEDLVHDVWLKVSTMRDGPIANPASYLFRAADTLMIDRYRSRRQEALREDVWAGSEGDGTAPTAERVVAARQEATRVQQALAALGSRREMVFRRARIDGVPQREIAAELGVSLSTVESDLRAACLALAELKERIG